VDIRAAFERGMIMVCWSCAWKIDQTNQRRMLAAYVDQALQALHLAYTAAKRDRPPCLRRDTVSDNSLGQQMMIDGARGVI
jgi:hypothetical protein